MSEEKSNFIRHIIDADLEGGKHDYVATRFPPEPNGYLHIGHAKSICLNFGLAQQYQSQNARCHLRFDDTNPATEDTEYVDSIKADVEWLGFDWGEHLYFASDYFDKMYELAEHLIKKGKAYVDSLSKDEIREYRGALGEPGRPSPYRDRSVEENLELFRKMKAGEFKDGEVVLRAKIDMESPNMIMRDPLLYRVRHETHHRTGDDWCIYPMYDYAHCLEDAIEGITHSICTLEFENNRELYDWVIAETEIQPVPRQYEFARLNLNYTVMSKRKLRQLVEDGDVDGWDDPRMPTIAGLRRRGVTAESIRNFCDMIGVAKANSMVDFQLFEFAIRDDLNHKAPRIMGVLDPLKLTITNYEGDGEELTISHWPHDVPNEGDRQVPFGKNIFVERSDFLENPPKKWRRLSPGAEVRLRRAYVVKVDEVLKDDDGNVTELLCTYYPETKSGSDTSGKKVRGVIHWVSADKGIAAEVRMYDRLFSVERPDSVDADYKTLLNPDSLIVKNAVLEPAAVSAPEGTRFQFERHGYFWRDPGSEGAVFNRIVPLKDSWTKSEEKSTEPPKVAETKQVSNEKSDSKRPKNYHRIVAREGDPVLQERYEKLQALGVSEKQADVLSGDRGVSDFFESFEDDVDSKKAAAWVVNTMLPALDDEAFAAPKFDARSIATLLQRVDDGDITSAGSKTVFEKLRDDGGDVDALISDLGLAKISDAGAIQTLVDEVFAENPKQLETYRGGKESLFGFFVGQVMKKTGGSADASVVQEVLRNSL